MLKGLFSLDNPVIRVIVKIGMIWYLNILWLVCSIPIITMGASTTALIYSCMKLQQEEGYPTNNFFHSFRENLKQATGIWICYLFAGSLLAYDLIYWNQNHQGGSKFLWAVSLALLILYVISFLWVFAIQSKFVNPIWKTILYSFLLPFRNIKVTILMGIMLFVVVYLNVTTIFLVNFLTINLGIGFLAYLFSIYYKDSFAKYIPKETEEI